MARTILAVVTVLAIAAAFTHESRAQDVGSAVADRIYTNTAILWNEYVSAVADYQARRYWLRQREIRKKRDRNYNTILQRIRANPEERDMLNGDALNAVMRDLLDPAISKSSFRYQPVVITADVVRRIPFKLDKENLVFSMRRLTAGGERWPPALQDPKFSYERREYERALDAVLEQQIEGKMTIDTINAVEKTVDELLRKLDVVFPGPTYDKLYIEAKSRLNELKKMSRQLIKSGWMQRVIGRLDRYSGTTIGDLRDFMQEHALGFAAAESPDERSLYPELYALLLQQREQLQEAARQPPK